MRIQPSCCRWFCLACAVLCIGRAPAQTATETVLYTFQNFPQGTNPYGTLIRDASGNLYGTTNAGCAANAGGIFEAEASGSFKVLYCFQGGTDGASPYAGVVLDSAGNLYGTTYQGGLSGRGVVYKLNTSGQESVLYSFTGGADGSGPYAGVIRDSAGNLYGTTYNGGTANAGVVYRLSPAGQETVLYNFTGGADGENPYAGVTFDSAGNLYGTTYYGGAVNGGVLYKLSPSGQETVLHNFAPGPGSCVSPYAGVIVDKSGNLYGTANSAVYKVTACGHYTQLADLAWTEVGGVPSAGLTVDSSGNLYGTTDGAQQDTTTLAPWGAVYKVSTSGTLTILHRFRGFSNGKNSNSGKNAGVILDAEGNLYGTSFYGGVGGMIFKLDTTGQETAIHKFPAAPGGSFPFGGVIRDRAGNIYGTAGDGGATNQGALYRLDPAGHETALHSFAGPVGSVIARDLAGNLYATGGAGNGLGAIYKVALNGGYTVLYSFTGGEDGTGSSGVNIDAAGNLYGVADGGAAPEGLVFKLDTNGQFTILHAFTGGTDGGDPDPGVFVDPKGNIYGAAYAGGAAGLGVVYEVTAAGRYRVLYTFTGEAGGGGAPRAGPVWDSAGNAYGTAAGGGANQGIVYKISPAGQETVLYTFMGWTDGGGPMAGVVRDAAGNLYGTTEGGGLGAGPANVGAGYGVVYKVDPAGLETVLYTFTGAADGGGPESGVLLDSAGNLYGTCPEGGTAGAGVLYTVTPQ